MKDLCLLTCISLILLSCSKNEDPIIITPKTNIELFISKYDTEMYITDILPSGTSNPREPRDIVVEIRNSGDSESKFDYYEEGDWQGVISLEKEYDDKIYFNVIPVSGVFSDGNPFDMRGAFDSDSRLDYPRYDGYFDCKTGKFQINYEYINLESDWYRSIQIFMEGYRR
jgi:hypothetical protein